MRTRLLLRTLPFALSLGGYGAAARAAEFEETFALAADREAVLKELVPGTEDYFYYHALHAQNAGKAGEVRELLTRWSERFPGGNPRRAMLDTRQRLLDYATDPAGTVEWLKTKLGLTYDHHRLTPDAPPDVPTALDQAAISLEAFRAAIPAGEPLASLTDAGLRKLVESGAPLTPAERRALLTRLTTPDLPGLADLVLQDLKSQDSGGFGSLPIHGALLSEQLADLLAKEPALWNNEAFVHNWMLRLAPSNAVNAARDPAARLAWLERLEGFTKTLPSAFHSLKAQILYQRLAHERKMGKPADPARLAAYLQLPRQAFFLNPRLVERPESQRYPADLSADFSTLIGLPAPGDDAPLVRSLLLEIFTADPDTTLFQPLLEENWLQGVLAEARLTSGAADAERFTALLPPDVFQSLRDRSDLEFAPDSPEILTTADGVKLDLFVKNVPRLLVKVYEINTENHYQVKGAEVNTDLDLDGLVANREFTADQAEPPLRRVKRSFDFPELKGRRGVWMIEFIGGGKSSRALVRKGEIRAAAQPTAAGTVVTVTDETGAPLPRAYALLGAQRFTADGHGLIDIPFSTKPGAQPVTLGDGDGFSSLETLDIAGENYQLKAGIHVPREFLLPGRVASAVIRPSLLSNSRPLDPDVLENARVTVTTESFQGRMESGGPVKTSTVIPVTKLSADTETLVDFRVPENARSFTLTLSGSVKNLITGQPVELSDSVNLTVNGISSTERTSDVYFSREPDGWVAQCLGKNGEPMPNVVMEFTMRRPEFDVNVSPTLRTDAEGRIRLGALAGITSVQYLGGDHLYRRFTPEPDRAALPPVAHLAAGETLRLPWPWASEDAAKGAFSLMEIRGGKFVRLMNGGLAVKNGVLESGPLEPGEYQAFVRPQNTVITVRVAAAPAGDNGYSRTPSLAMERDAPAPLAISDPVTTAGDAPGGRKFTITNATPETRVHVFVSRFVPEFDAFAPLRGAPRPLPAVWQPAWRPGLFQSARAIGEEYRYVLDRKTAAIFAGNLLPRPGLLLNPWAIADTATAIQTAAQGDAPAAMSGAVPAAAPVMQPPAEMDAAAAADPFGGDQSADLSFLRDQGALSANLRPDKDGTITIRPGLLEKGQWLRVVAVNGDSAVCRDFVLPAVPLATRDLRLETSLDPAKHFTQRNEVTILEKDKPVTLPRGLGSAYKVYGSLSDAWALLSALNQSPEFLKFRFLPTWPTLDTAEKQRLYSEHACHELSFFLSRRDPEFFRTVVLPHVANKRDKTFMDHYLLGADLSGYLAPWKYARLNTLERILLGRRLPAERAATAKNLADFLAALPGAGGGEAPFHFALFGLESDGELGGGGYGEGAKSETAAGVFAEQADSVDALTENKDTTRDRRLPDAENVARRSMSLSKDSLRPAKLGKTLRLEVAGRAQFFRQEDPTREWAENNYYNVPLARQTAELIPPRRFWSDFAAHADDALPFLSGSLAEVAAGTPTEMLLAFSVLDLPFDDGVTAVKETTDTANLTLSAARTALLFHRSYAAGDPPAESAGLLLSQNFEKTHAGAAKSSSFQIQAGEMQTCTVAVTNTGEKEARAEALFQIPQGAIALGDTLGTQSVPVSLAGFQTTTLKFHYYFPKAGRFTHYPAQLGVNGKTVAAAAPVTFEVVEKLDTTDKATWDYISQNGTEDEVIAFLEKTNLRDPQFNLNLVDWRLADAAFYRRALTTLRARHEFDPTVWSYALRHGDEAATREYLEAHTALPDECGPSLDSPLLSVNAVERGAWQWLEYSPLINARAHQLGGTREILNDRYRVWHQSFIHTLTFRPAFSDDDRLGVTADLLLQERIAEALTVFRTIDPARVPERLQYDYLHAWLAMSEGDTATARRIPADRTAYSVNRWREKFAAIQSQLDEIDGKEPAAAGAENRALRQNEMANAAPGFDFKIEGKEIVVSSRNVKELTVNYYPMDLEFLFSANPFVSQDTGRFRMIRPNQTERVPVPENAAAAGAQRIPLPEAYRSANVLVEITAAGRTRTAASYANELDVRVSENQGLLQVVHAGDQRPLAKVYVKVFAEVNGQAVFHKDGYTDLRGKFDYASISTDGLDQATRFSLLVMSPDHGATVREVAPPRR